MTGPRFRDRHPFPDPEEATPEGLLAYGGDLAPERLLAAYESGIFPWYESGPILWFSPDPRTVLRPSELHVSRRLRRTLRSGRFEVRCDTAFEAVIRHCATVERVGQDGTWINADMIEAYCELHRMGFAHSFESFEDGALVGGIYGISLGGAFFGESMFALRPDASKVALHRLCRQLEAWEYDLLDCQVHTDHMARMGAVEWPRRRFLRALDASLARPTRRGRWTLEPLDDGPG